MDDFSISNSISRASVYDNESMYAAYLEDAAGRAAKGETPQSISNETIRSGDEILGTYTVSGNAVHGGMGSVWKVRHRDWGTDLAMKRPQPRFFAEGSERRRQDFVSECENWIRLGLHPNIVSCYYVREVGGVPTVFSEWMENGSLSDCIGNGSLYGGSGDEVQERILDIAIQAARGLQYAHENGLVHQDMKPGNLLLTGSWDAKVGDFGLAKAREQLQSASGRKASGYTPAYCPKEQENGEEPARWMDIYSWALTVLEMYAGKRLWAAGADVRDHCGEFFPLCRIPVPGQLQQLLTECTGGPGSGGIPGFSDVEKRLLDLYRTLYGTEYPRSDSGAAPDTADSLNNKALSMLDLGQPETAASLWADALDRYPDHWVTVYNKSLYDWRKGNISYKEVLRRCEAAGASAGYEATAARWIDAVRAEGGEDPANSDESGILSPGFSICSVAVSPDGKRIYTIGEDYSKVLRCIDTDTRQLLYTSEIPPYYRCFTLSPDGEHIIYLFHDHDQWHTGEAGLVAVRAGDGSVRSRLPVRDRFLNFCAAPDGQHCYLYDSGKVIKWNYLTDTVVKSVENDLISGVMVSVCMAPDGRGVLLGHEPRENAVLLDGKSMETVCSWLPGEDKEEIPWFFEDEEAPGNIRYDIRTLSFARPEGLTHEQVMRYIAGSRYHFSRDNKRCLTRLYDRMTPKKKMEIWDTTAPRCMCALSCRDEKHSVTAYSASADLSLIVSAASGFSLQGHSDLWLQSGILESRPAPWELSEAKKYAEVVENLDQADRMAEGILRALEKDDLNTACGMLDEAEAKYGIHRFFDLHRQAARCCRKGAFAESYEIAAVPIRPGGCLAFSPDSRMLAAGTESTISILDAEGKTMAKLETPETVNTLAFSRDGRRLAAGLKTAIQILEYQEDGFRLQKTVKIAEIGNRVNIAFTPDDGRIVFFRDENDAGFLDPASGEILFHDHRDYEERRDGQSTGSILFSPDGREISIGEFLADADTLKEKKITCSGIVIPAENRILTVDRAYVTWDMLSWTPEGKTDLPVKEKAVAACVTADGEYLIAGYETGPILLWSLSRKKLAAKLPFPPKKIDYLTLSPDGCLLAASAEDGLHLLAVIRKPEPSVPGNWQEKADPYMRQFLMAYPHPSASRTDILIRELRDAGLGGVNREEILRTVKEWENSPASIDEGLALIYGKEPAGKGDILLDRYEALSDRTGSDMDGLWRVRRKEDGAIMALRRPLIRYAGEQKERQIAGFRKRYEKWESLGTHPNIISCRVETDDRGIPAAVTDWIGNGSLADHIRDGSLYEGTKSHVKGRLLSIACQMADGFYHAQQHNLIHNNIRPEKILLTDEWGVRINDFRYAREQMFPTREAARMPRCVPFNPLYQGNTTADKDTVSWALTVAAMYAGGCFWKKAQTWDRNITFPERWLESYKNYRADIPGDLSRILAECLAGFIGDFAKLTEELGKIPGVPEAGPASGMEESSRTPQKLSVFSRLFGSRTRKN